MNRQDTIAESVLATKAAMARWLVWLVESQAGVPHSSGHDATEA